MGLSDQVLDLETQGADMRQEARGTKSDGTPQLGRMDDALDSETFTCYFSRVLTQEQLDELGFRDVHDCVLRVRKTETNFKSVIGKLVRLIEANDDNSDIVLRLSERGHSRMNPEYVYGCKAVT